MDSDEYKRFYSSHMILYDKDKYNGRGFNSIPVLNFLWGKEWNNYALCYVHSLRPTSIRVSKGMVTCDARTWRVTVDVDEKNLIKSITQEVEVALPNDCQNGYDLRLKIGGFND